jgi:hypothetical protein
MRLKERKGGKSIFIVHLRDLSEGGEERRRIFLEKRLGQEGRTLRRGCTSLGKGALVYEGA